MRIVHIDTERTWRGGQQQVLSLVKGLHARGHENIVVLREGSPLAERLPAGDARLHFTRSLGEWDLVAAGFLNRYLTRQRVHVVHAHTGHAVALAALSTLGTGIPVVSTRRVDVHLSANVFSRWKHIRCRRIVAISHAVRRVLIEDGVPPDKIDLVPSGVDFQRFEGVVPTRKADWGFEEDHLVVGQVAALAGHKDQATFLRAFALLIKSVPNARAVLIGEGTLRTELEQLSVSLGLTAHVKFMGYRDKPLNDIAGFDLFCLSSREEGLGTSILDAMALRVPVVATRAGGIPELVLEGETGFLAEARNPESLAHAWERCIRSLGGNSRLLDAACATAKRFDIVNTVTRMEEVYRKAFEGGSSRPLSS